MLRYSLDQNDAANAIDAAVKTTIDKGIVTSDIAQGGESYSTDQVAQAIANAI